MTPAVKSAVAEWVSSLAIGCIPLAAHGLCSLVGDPATSPGEWSTDLLYIAITNSGLSATTVFTRTSKGRRSLSVGAYVLMAATILLLVIAAIVYGLRASGHAQQMNMTLVAAPILFGSALVSMYFEVVLALSYQGSTRRSR